jgi:ADP-ribose pyrophosphatase
MSDPVQIIAEGRFLRFAKRQNWEYVERVNVRDVAVLVPITSEDEIVLVEQFRIPVQARMIELPAGLVGDEEEFREEDLLDAANRELEEETGYRAERLTLLTRAPSSGGMTSELVSFLHATGLRKVGSGGGVDGEDITVHVVPLREARRWLRGKEADGFLLDPKIHAGLYLVRPVLSR